VVRIVVRPFPFKTYLDRPPQSIARSLVASELISTSVLVLLVRGWVRRCR
jgi:hypothetical protein